MRYFVYIILLLSVLCWLTADEPDSTDGLTVEMLYTIYLCFLVFLPRISGRNSW